MTPGNIFIWLLGVAIGNALMDVVTIMKLSAVKPTAFGVLVAILHLPYLFIPKPFKTYNIYFSLLLSWLTALIALIAIIILFFANNANNSNGTTQQQ